MIYNISYMIYMSCTFPFFHDLFHLKVDPANGDDLFLVLTYSPLRSEIRAEEAIDAPGVASNSHRHLEVRA